MRNRGTTALTLTILAALSFSAQRSHARAALLLEEPCGFFGTLIPTGHNAIYIENVCAETPVALRRCQPGEYGVVLTRDEGIGGYDWVAIPLLPYLYSVEKSSEVPAYADSKMVWSMRNRYHEAHLLSLGENLRPGNIVRGGWALLAGMSYERRIYAFAFETASEKDDALIALLNAGKNRSHFQLAYRNCSDFARLVLNFYFPGAFRREIFPDAGMTTPKALTHALVRYARKRPEIQLTTYEILQIPGYRRLSRPNKGVVESLATIPYAIPIALANPYIAGGLLLDYLVRGRFHLVPSRPRVLAPGELSALATPARPIRGPSPSRAEALPAADDFAETRSLGAANSILSGAEDNDD
jgi:hypothetical protein